MALLRLWVDRVCCFPNRIFINNRFHCVIVSSIFKLFIFFRSDPNHKHNNVFKCLFFLKKMPPGTSGPVISNLKQAQHFRAQINGAVQFWWISPTCSLCNCLRHKTVRFFLKRGGQKSASVTGLFRNVQLSDMSASLLVAVEWLRDSGLFAVLEGHLVVARVTALAGGKATLHWASLDVEDSSCGGSLFVVIKKTYM